MNDNDKIIKEKVEFFKDNKIAVHIVKKDGRFHNGLILEHSGDLIILDDEVLGSMPIYFLEVKYIEKRKEK